MTLSTTGDASAAPPDEPIDLDALAEAQFAEPEETPAPEPSAAEPPTDDPAAPTDTPDGPDPEAESKYIFRPFDLDIEGEKRRIESPEEVEKAFKVVGEHGRFTRKAAAERGGYQGRFRKQEDELKLLRKDRDDNDALLGKLKANSELLEYVNQETGVKIDPDILALRQENAEIRQRLDRDGREKMRTQNIQILDATRVEQFGYTEPIKPQEIQAIEAYAEANGLSRDQLYSNPLISAGVYAVLVGMGYIAPPTIPQMVTDKTSVDADVAAQAKEGAANLPPATSGAHPSPKPYNSKGKTPAEVLRDMKTAGQDFGGEPITEEVLEAMGT